MGSFMDLDRMTVCGSIWTFLMVFFASFLDAVLALTDRRFLLAFILCLAYK